MNASTPLVCHVCWPKKTAHIAPCEHAMQVYEQGIAAGRANQTDAPPAAAPDREGKMGETIEWYIGRYVAQQREIAELRRQLDDAVFREVALIRRVKELEADLKE